MTDPVLIIACGALARELVELKATNKLDHLTIECLPSELHNRPDKIPAAIEARLDSVEGYGRILLGYADCGTGGRIDDICERRGVERLPGAHCYEFFAGSRLFEQLHDAEPGTFYLTDFLAKHFELLVYDGLGLNKHPQLRSVYFSNYRRLVYLAQTDNPALEEKARAAADKLGLAFDHHRTGYGALATLAVGLTVELGARR